ncbi:Ig-like domain-containing protein [Phosphitispora fastidiosa]|uniref:Ig-like domain-containing protein n=1 Tax=Phosphitispora fastidiosa TaxID=2837202 RepID=UPI001E302B0C|nr:tandem-95 repeat protein [Phosphitispora fastidiosa]MBU7005561.1 hypothetical protein [Phosphitispora fastidiosa]
MRTSGFGRKRFLQSFILGMMIISLITLISPGAFASEANDVKEHWAGAVISEWLDGSLASGYPDGAFKPDNPVTRAEFLTMVNRVMGFKDQADINFPDVKKEGWYYDEIARAVEAGYITGDTGGTMSPNRKISRQEVSVILFRLLKLEAEKQNRPVDGFQDYGNIGSWSKEEVNAVVAAGYVEGYPDTTFKPDRDTTRAEAVVILNRAVGELYNKEGVFGASEDVVTIEGNVTISAANVNLKNMIIEGDLLLTAGIGDGDARLTNITVEGRTVITGGGENSIIFTDSTLNKVVVQKKNGKVRVVAHGNTNIKIVSLASGARLETDALTDKSTGITTVFVTGDEEVILTGKFGTVSIEQEGARVSLVGGSVENLNITETAVNANITVSGNTKVTKLEVSALASVTGKGTIGTVVMAEEAEGSTVAVTTTTSGSSGGSQTTPNQDQDAPTGLLGVAPGRFEGSDGKILGVDNTMEYKLSTDTEWTAVTGTEITGLSAGTYNVRCAARTGYNAGTAAEVTVPEGEKSSDVSLSVFTIGGMDATGLEGMAIGFPPDGNYNGADLFVEDFTDFAGIVAEPRDPKAVVNGIFKNNIPVVDAATEIISENDRIMVWVIAENGFEEIYSVYARALTYSIELSASDPTDLGTLTEGYGPETPAEITVTRTGTGDITNLAVALSGINADSFTITQPQAATLNAGVSSTTFTVVPKDGLAVGSYTADVNVTSDNGVSESFTVSFVVEAATYSITTSTAGGTAVLTTDPVDEAEEGATVTVNIADIEAGKYLKSITVTDTESAAISTTELIAGESYTFTMPAKAVTVAVELNNIPAAVDDSVTLDEDGNLLVAVLANDTDADGDTLSITGFDQGTNGTVVQEGNSLKYTPDADYNGADNFGYTISDGNGGTATATVNVTINSINDEPVAANETVTVNEDSTTLVDVLVNDTDVDGDTLSIAGFAQGTNGTVAQEGDSLRYTPDANYNGADSFSYTISDGNGGTVTATVNVTVTPVNDQPVAANDSAVVDEDGNVVIAVLANDTDVDGDTLSIAEFPQGSHGTVELADNKLRYTPTANYHGTDSFSYGISDGNGGTATATVNVTINSINDEPVAANETVTVNEDSTTLVDVLVNDTDVDGDTLSIAGFAQGTNGTVAQEGDSLRYTPDANYNGADSFSYTISDGNGGTVTATVNVTVTPVNDQPVAANDSAVVDEDSTVLIDVLLNDTDIDGDTLIITGETQGVHGSVVWIDNKLQYTPNTNYNGADSFMYEIGDGKGGITTATVNVTINPINDAPTAVAGQAVQTGNATPAAVSGNPAAAAYSGNMAGWFEDIDADELTYVVVSAEDESLNDVSGDVVTDGAGITYTPAGAQADQDVTIIVKANDGTIDSTGNVTITVTVGSVPADADLSEFSAGLVEAGDKIQGIIFGLAITGAKDTSGNNLSGDINVTVTSNQADGEVFNGTLTFTGGAVNFPINLLTVANHTLTIAVAGVTDSVELPVNVVASQRAISPGSASFANTDASATITITAMTDAAGNDVLAGFTADDGSIYSCMMNDNATTLIDVTVTKAAGSADLVIANPAQATAAGAYTLMINRMDGNMWEINVTVT